MNYGWIEEYCLSKKGAVKEFKIEWEASLYRVGGKIFALVGEDNVKKTIISLKCDPMTAQLLRSQYADIVPGYHLNKEHWNSVFLEGATPDEIMKQMIDMSYELVLNSLTKKAIKQIQE
ncbi:MAG TPA: MmcQ/YjbR family DNA-binding protein [Candidatus Wallbacteria bacterium]|nr:MAG: hypothetical protein BWY32_00685 [bacterium ADurb.Bin243]HOD42672.1 MmcQ/YjbR family DNA-binding protein [Candidatus Wallbacteria bacterium]HPG60032.1 MmcQ/YjbR family DNA-binding protein [Candidatus Wallbacteria bacterium]